MATTTIPTTITLITGANQGIGLATATILASHHSHHVIIGSRNPSAGAAIASSLTASGHSASSIPLDLTSDVSISAAASYIEQTFGRLDVLINNAGILLDTHPIASDTRALFTQTLSTNVVGTACVTEALLPLLRKSAAPRVVFVSSVMGSIGMSTDSSTAWYSIDYKAYDASKAAVNMLAVNYARILKDVGGVVNAVCPGLVKSNLTQWKFGGTPEEGARRIVELATVKDEGPTATFSNAEGEIQW